MVLHAVQHRYAFLPRLRHGDRPQGYSMQPLQEATVTAYGIQLIDRMGQRIGGLILLDHGNRQHKCDWLAGCGNTAIIAVMPSVRGAEPQLACADHLGKIHGSIWQSVNPPEIRAVDATPILYR